jgi:hypothetical protein
MHKENPHATARSPPTAYLESLFVAGISRRLAHDYRPTFGDEEACQVLRIVRN